MKKIYVVTSGSYSDYGIEKVFSTREKAQKYISLVNNKHNFYARVNDDIEEYDIDPDINIPKTHHKFETFYSVTMDREGNMRSPCRETGFDVFHPENTDEHYRLSAEKCYNGETGKFEYYYLLGGYDINADNEQHAIKKMSEKRSYLLRTNKWPEEYRPNEMPNSIEVE